jgi:hypothetical protein
VKRDGNTKVRYALPPLSSLPLPDLEDWIRFYVQRIRLKSVGVGSPDLTLAVSNLALLEAELSRRSAALHHMVPHYDV